VNLLELQGDPAAFRANLLIDTDEGPLPLGQCVDPWQDADFKALDSGWQRAVQGAETRATCQRGWLERGRGHSKTADLGVMGAWALFASRRRLSGVGAAGDQDQARLLRDAISRLLYLNPWLGQLLEVQAYKVVNPRTDSALEIISSDVPTSYGLTPDFCICDEVTHWRGRDLWDSLISSAAKRSTCMFVVITNAGLTDDWQWKTREVVRQDPKWHFSRLDGPLATWITKDRLEEQERLLPGIAYRRLWLNEWTSGAGDALTAEDVQAAFRADLKPMTDAMRVELAGWDFVGGLDLGVSRDASALCILGVSRGKTDHGKIRLALTKVWRPRKGQKINLGDVEQTLVEVNGRFKLKQLNYDPWQAVAMAQRLQASSFGTMDSGLRTFGDVRESRLPMVEVPSTQKYLQAMATTCLEAFNDRRLELYEDADLKRDLGRMRVEERPSGFRLSFPRDSLGHGDLGQAFLLALLAASELAGKKRQQFWMMQDGIVYGKEKEGEDFVTVSHPDGTSERVPYDPTRHVDLRGNARGWQRFVRGTMGYW
jgi:phage terminase large subunit-like protein